MVKTISFFTLILILIGQNTYAARGRCWKAIARVGIFDPKAPIHKGSPVTWGEYLKTLEAQDEYLDPKNIKESLKKVGWNGAYRNQGFALGGESGDFVHVVSPSSNDLILFFGDAEGHSTISASTASYLHSLLTSEAAQREFSSLNPESGLVFLDNNIKEFQKEQKMMALSIARVNTQKKQLTFSNAAMPGLFIINANGEIKHIESGGPPVGSGLVEALHDPKVVLQLQSKDLLVFASDGIYDAAGKKDWDFRHFLKKTYSKSGHHADALATSLMKDHPIQFDDRSVFVIQVP